MNPAGFHGAVRSTREEDNGTGYMCQFCNEPLYREWKADAQKPL